MDPNPIVQVDCPDPDVIRVGDTYYMAATTVHFMPGCEILRSFDLLHWEHACYVYRTLDGTPAQRLEEDQNIYGMGMWAPSLRFARGRFYLCFSANDTRKTYLYTADSVCGPWQKRTIAGFYHDPSLLFDDDGRIYLAHGGGEIWLTELSPDLTGPRRHGLHRRIVRDEGNAILGYEGSHIYKINGRYYLFLIHSKPDRWMRIQACFAADSLEGTFVGGDVWEDDRGYCGQGVAQGGVVDTADGRWYAVLFQDHGAVGRLPILLPVRWENRYPVFGEGEPLSAGMETQRVGRGSGGRPLVGSDEFTGRSEEEGIGQLRSWWQFNHEPDPRFFQVDPVRGTFTLTAARRCASLLQARNTITQRMRFPACAAEVTVEASGLSEGDYAGLCVLQKRCGMAAVTRREGKLWLVREDGDAGKEAVRLRGTAVRFRVEADFDRMKDEARYFYWEHPGAAPAPFGRPQKLYFDLEHFAGCRFGLFLYATKRIGGRAVFQHFVYE